MKNDNEMEWEIDRQTAGESKRQIVREKERKKQILKEIEREREEMRRRQNGRLTHHVKLGPGMPAL